MLSLVPTALLILFSYKIAMNTILFISQEKSNRLNKFFSKPIFTLLNVTAY